MNRRSLRGNALIEFALVIPLLFLLIINVINFGGLFYAWITVSHATRSAAQLVVAGPAYVGYGTPTGLQGTPSNSTIVNLLTDCSTVNADHTTRPPGDMCSLPNQPSVAVTVCMNNSASGTATYDSPATCLPPNDPTTGTMYSDPEPYTSVLTTVTVRYRYCPFIAAWEFPSLGIHSTLPACSSDGTTGGVPIRRVAAMRMLQ